MALSSQSGMKPPGEVLSYFFVNEGVEKLLKKLDRLSRITREISFATVPPQRLL